MKKLMLAFALNIQLFGSNVMITHSDVETLIPEQEVREVFQNVAKKSITFQLCRRLPNMSSNRTKIKVLDVLPLVYWQETSTSLKKTTKAAWIGKQIIAEELAVIIPIAEADLDDADYDLWGAIRPQIEEAIANKIDAAVFFGEDKPASFPDGIVESAISHGYSYTKGDSETLYNAISEAMGLVEESGYSVNGLVGGPSIKKLFRGLTDTTGQLITGDEISALPRAIVDNGAWDKDEAIALLGDFNQAVFAVRQDVKYKVLTESVISDADGKVILNLAQQDSVGLRITFRFGWQLPNPVNRLKPEEAGRLPFALLAPAKPKIGLTLTPGEATTFASKQKVKMTANVNGAKIYYTTDGTTPSNASTLYEGEIELTATTTVKAIAIRENYANSDVVSVTYTKS